MVEILEADYAADPHRRVRSVIVGQPGAVHVGAGHRCELVLADGTTLDVPVVDGHVRPVRCRSAATTLPTGGGIDETSTIVIVPPAAMPRRTALAGRAGLFAPAYALWEREAPLPRYQHLASLGRALPGSVPTCS